MTLRTVYDNWERNWIERTYFVDNRPGRKWFNQKLLSVWQTAWLNVQNKWINSDNWQIILVVCDFGCSFQECRKLENWWISILRYSRDRLKMSRGLTDYSQQLYTFLWRNSIISFQIGHNLRPTRSVSMKKSFWNG